jgi:hypothetical protein
MYTGVGQRYKVEGIVQGYMVQELYIVTRVQE